MPPPLEDAMSMQAQAERERQARVILGDSERQIAEKFVEAANTYASNPNCVPFARDEHAVRGAEAQFPPSSLCPAPRPTACSSAALPG